MKPNPFQNLWEFMKQHGYFQKYDNYSQWRFKKFGEKESLEEWKERELTEKERQDFDYIFGE